MPFTADEFVRCRPFLYHLTNSSNVKQITSSRQLLSAARLMRQGRNTSFMRRKRPSSISIDMGKFSIHVRDQQPLHSGNIRLEGGWSFEDMIQTLNETVFFWPGTQLSPIAHGRRHFERYAKERPAILRMSTEQLYQANPGVVPRYCRYNSGSPRCSFGAGSPRGPSTFVPCTETDYSTGKAFEVTSFGSVTLPAVLEISESILGPWQAL